jgi:hypothetical protein
MRLGCPCGAEITDQTDYLPNKARLLRERHWEQAWSDLAGAFEDLATAVAEGRTDEWIGRVPGGVEPLRFRASLAVTGILRKYHLDAYQCERCGRIFVEDHRDPERRRFRSFAPDDDWEGTLDVPGFRLP